MTQVNPRGLHHVTAIATDPQRNVDFYTRALGLRLVKQTVNFDAPDTYHLYYGDKQGSPSSLLTFFPWPGVPKGRDATGDVVEPGGRRGDGGAACRDETPVRLLFVVLLVAAQLGFVRDKPRAS